MAGTPSAEHPRAFVRAAARRARSRPGGRRAGRGDRRGRARTCCSPTTPTAATGTPITSRRIRSRWPRVAAAAGGCRGCWRCSGRPPRPAPRSRGFVAPAGYLAAGGRRGRVPRRRRPGRGRGADRARSRGPRRLRAGRARHPGGAAADGGFRAVQPDRPAAAGRRVLPAAGGSTGARGRPTGRRPTTCSRGWRDGEPMSRSHRPCRPDCRDPTTGPHLTPDRATGAGTRRRSDRRRRRAPAAASCVDWLLVALITLLRRGPRCSGVAFLPLYLGPVPMPVSALLGVGAMILAPRACYRLTGSMRGRGAAGGVLVRGVGVAGAEPQRPDQPAGDRHQGQWRVMVLLGLGSLAAAATRGVDLGRPAARPDRRARAAAVRTSRADADDAGRSH